MWVNNKIFIFGWTNPLIQLWKRSEANSPMWLVWFDFSKRPGMSSSAPTNFPANYLNTHNHAHMNTQISPLPTLPYCAANCLSSHPAAALICTTNRPVRTHTHTHTHTLSLSFCVLLSSSVCLLRCHMLDFCSCLSMSYLISLFPS